MNHDKCFVCRKTAGEDPQREKRGCVRLLDLLDKSRGPQDTAIVVDACRTDVMRETQEAAREYRRLAARGVVPRAARLPGAVPGAGVAGRDIAFAQIGQDFAPTPRGALDEPGELAMLFSCQEGGTAAEFGGHGLFTRALLDELDCAAGKGSRVFVDDAFRRRLNARMKRLFETVAPGGRAQRAEFQHEGEGDGVELLPGLCAPQSAPAAPARAGGAPAEGGRHCAELPGGVLLPAQWCMPTTCGKWTAAHGGDWFDMGARSDEDGANCFVPCDRRCAETARRVRITHGFWMGETEVTQRQWTALMGTTVLDLCAAAFGDDTPYEYADTAFPDAPIFEKFRDRKRGKRPQDLCCSVGDDVPAYFASWHDAKAFCAKLTESERAAGRLPEGYVWRLPTEAEWEYACRAGSTTTLPNGQPFRIRQVNGSFVGSMDAPALDDIAWYGGNSSVGYEGRGADTLKWERYGKRKQYPGGRAAPRSAFGKTANAWGLRDMLGNVWEWCEDWLDRLPRGNAVAEDPVQSARPSGNLCRVARGGSWYSDAQECRPAARWRFSPGFRNWTVGFRVVLAPELPAADDGTP